MRVQTNDDIAALFSRRGQPAVVEGDAVELVAGGGGVRVHLRISVGVQGLRWSGHAEGGNRVREVTAAMDPGGVSDRFVLTMTEVVVSDLASSPPVDTVGDRWESEPPEVDTTLPDRPWLSFPRGQARIALNALEGASLRHPGLHVSVWDEHAATALRGRGWTERWAREHVARDLADLPPTPPELATRRVVDLPTRAFLAALTQCLRGCPDRDVRGTAAEELDDLMRLAGPALDPRLWVEVMLEDVPIGLLLLHRSGDVGTSLFTGLRPAFRRRGLGAPLHALGLRLLDGAGAGQYVGAADVENGPMCRIFAVNGCVPTGIERSFCRPAAARRPLAEVARLSRSSLG